MLRAVSGQLWIEATGGIVVLRNSFGRVTLSFDETRAAASIDRAFALLSSRPRITRMYVYHWQSGATSHVDAGLARPDGSLRPSYAAIQRAVAGRPSAAASAPAPASTVRWTATWSKVKPAYLLVRARCATSGGRCAGRVGLSLRTRRTSASTTRSAGIGTRTYRTSSTRHTVTVRVRVSRALRKRLRASTVPATAAAGCVQHPGGVGEHADAEAHEAVLTRASRREAPRRATG